MANSTNAPAPVLSTPGPFPVGIPEQGTSSLWDRLSNWASENKGVVYTIAGVTLVVGAGGAIYYLNSSDSSTDASATGTANKRRKQRERRREKERAAKESAAKEEAKTGAQNEQMRLSKNKTDEPTEAKKASVAATTDDELPEVDESTVGALSEEVRIHCTNKTWRQSN